MPTQVGIHDLLDTTEKIVDADLRQHNGGAPPPLEVAPIRKSGLIRLYIIK